MAGIEDLLGPNVTFWAVALLIGFSFGGVLYALFQPWLSGSKRSAERLTTISTRATTVDVRKQSRDGEKRRKNIQDQLKEFEEKQKKKHGQSKVGLMDRIEQAGLQWGIRQFVFFSIVCGIVFLVLGLLATQNLLLVLGIAFVGGAGFPRWFINYKRKKRFDKFLDELPGAVDIIVRGVKAGLPLGDCIRIVGNEAAEPVAGEFRKIIEAQVMGISLAEAVGRLPERMPLAEANFFAIVINIQQKAGGSLSESLGNLSKVLRGRKAMKRKIKALSSEAKSSAAIIGALPFLVTGILSLVAPDYISLLFTTSGGNIIIAGGLFWMFCGIMVMRNMINFDF